MLFVKRFFSIFGCFREIFCGFLEMCLKIFSAVFVMYVISYEGHPKNF